MSIEDSDIKKIAHLARISIAEEDIPGYATELTNIMTWVEQMNAVDTDHIEPMAHPLHAVQRLRDDVVSEPDLREAAQAIAPETEAGLYLVPKVIE